MKDRILLTLLVSSILVSCSSVYKSGQTPDDVYYSPTRDVVKTEQKEEDKQEDKTASTEDQYLKMKVRDRYRWSQIDDYDYWVDSRYNTNCSCTCTQPNYGYNYHYGYYPIRYGSWYNNPYSPYYVAYNPKFIKGSTSGANIKAYTNHTYNNTNSSVNSKTGTTSNGSFLKRVFTSSGSTADRTERTFNNGSSSSSSNTSSSAGGKSGGYGSSGSSSSSGRGGRGN